MDEVPACLVRYGLMGHVGRFRVDPGAGFTARLKRGQAVVVQTDRGVELGEVLVAGGPYSSSEASREAQPGLSFSGPENREPDSHTRSGLDHPALLRLAAQADLEDARRSRWLGAERFPLCLRILQDGGWPLELIDVEPLLDPETTILHVLGAVDGEVSLLRAEFRARLNLDIHLEPAVANGSGIEPPPSDPAMSRRCGDCDCGDGGCSRASLAGQSVSAAEAVEGPRQSADCGTADSHSGCVSCGVSKWRAGRRHAGH